MINKKEVKKIGTLDKVLIFLAIFMVLFVIAMIVLHIVTGSTPDVLIGCVFAACIGEFSVTGIIQTNKEKCKMNEEDNMSEETSDKPKRKFRIRDIK